MTGAGIDYGMDLANIDNETGIRYGVVPSRDVLQAWADSSEPDYGEPTCPKCGNEVQEATNRQLAAKSYKGDGADYACKKCKRLYWSDAVYGDEPLSHGLVDNEYKAFEASDGDIFVEKSPYYCMTSFCSPCAPGAGYIPNADNWDGIKAYCLGPDFYEEEDEPDFHIFCVKHSKKVYCPDNSCADELCKECGPLMGHTCPHCDARYIDEPSMMAHIKTAHA